MVLGVGFLLVVSLVVSAVLTAVAGIVGGFLLIDAATAHTLDLFVSFAFITLLFAVIYKFVPDVRIAWRDVWIGAATTSLLFSAGKILIGFYLGHSTVTSILRGGRFARYCSIVGLLLISHVFLRRGVNPSLCDPVRIESHLRGKCSKP